MVINRIAKVGFCILRIQFLGQLPIQRQTETLAVVDWPSLNAITNAVNGASWVSVHDGGGVGIGYAFHAGQVIVADGTDEAAARLARVLRSDPGMGIIRHVDAGYDEAIKVAKEKKVKIPGLTY